MSKRWFLIALTCINMLGYSQQPVLVVQSFEYLWQKQLTYEGRVNILSDEDAQRAVEKSFKEAIQKRWNIEVDLRLTVKTFSPFVTSSPKFNTKLRSKQPGKWYLFLQMHDDPSTFYFNDIGGLGTRLQVKCKIVDARDSIILERLLSVGINIEDIPLEQVQLYKLLAHPTHILRTFDSVAHWLFATQYITQKEVWLRPARVYNDKILPSQPISSLRFDPGESMIHHLTEPRFLLRTTPPTYTRAISSRNIVGNAAGGVLTALTGIGTSKSKRYLCEASFSFRQEDNTVYRCVVQYAEIASSDRERELSRESNGTKSYSIRSSPYEVNERMTSAEFVNFIIREADTIARFTIKYMGSADTRNSYTSIWDGIDSSSIVPLKKEWKNDIVEGDVIVQISTGGDSISMKSSDEYTVKEFSINQVPVLIMYGKDVPTKAALLQPLSKADLTLLTMIASLPYGFFNNGGSL